VNLGVAVLNEATRSRPPWGELTLELRHGARLRERKPRCNRLSSGELLTRFAEVTFARIYLGGDVVSLTTRWVLLQRLLDHLIGLHELAGAQGFVDLVGRGTRGQYRTGASQCEQYQ
jgi:hypothetical protein